MHAQVATITNRRSMKPATALFILAVVALVAIGAIALMHIEGTTSASIALGPSDAGSVVALDVGGELTITLPANPSTGYSWIVTSTDTSLLTQVGEPEFSAGSDLIGAGGTITFRFGGSAIGHGDLQLDYLRAWEDAEPLDTYVVTVNVR